MEKKTYISPTLAVCSLAPRKLLAASIPVVTDCDYEIEDADNILTRQKFFEFYWESE